MYERICELAAESPPHLMLVPMRGLTGYITCGSGPDYGCVLYGPFADLGAEHPRDQRVFVVFRQLGNHVSLQYLVQDVDDDVFLNSHAAGAERWDTHGPVVVQAGAS